MTTQTHDHSPHDDSCWDPACGSTKPRSVLDDVRAAVTLRTLRAGFTEDHPDGTGFAYLRDQADKAHHECEVATEQQRVTWRLIVREAYRKAVAERDEQELRGLLVELAAHCIAWAEAIDRRSRP